MAQVMISRSCDQALHQAPHSAGVCLKIPSCPLPLPLPTPALTCALYNIKINQKNEELFTAQQ